MKKIFSIITVFVLGFVLIACDDMGPVDTIIIYTNQTQNGRGSQLEQLIKTAGFDFDVLFVEVAGQNLKNRLIAEKNAPIADVVLGGGLIEHIDLKNEGVLKQYVPSWANLVDEGLSDSDGYYTAWAIEPLYLAYNKKHFTDNPSEVTGTKLLAPTGWADLVANFSNKYNVFKASTSTGATIYASILSQFRDDNGEFGVSQAGWNLLANLINNGIVDRGSWQLNLAGDVSPISMTWAGAVMDIEQAFVVDLGVVLPEEGVPVTISQVAVVNSNNPARIAAAETFIEWWGLTETQVAWSEISFQAPANLAALELVDPKIRELNDVPFLDLDWEFIVENISSWIQKIELELIGS